MRVQVLIIAVACLALAGCNDEAIAEKVKQLRPLPNMQECPDLTALDNDTFEAAIEKLIEWKGKYKECAALNKEKKEWIERGQATE